MKVKTLIVIYLTIIHSVIAKIYPKLQLGIKLSKGDQLISTLGLFKLIMNDNDCSLNVYKFDKLIQNYTSMNKSYRGKLKQSCTFLNIINNRILTNNSSVFLELTSSNLSQIYLIIDDSAIIRLIGIKNPSGNLGPQDYDQIQYTNYSQPNSYLTILDSYNQINDKFTPTSNSNNWFFQISSSVLTITNPIYQISQNFNIPPLYFSINGVYNSENQTYPGMNFMDGFLYNTVCSGQKNRLYGPFVLQIDQYLPKVTIYDQDKYIVLQYSALKNINANPCPKFTFSLNDKCYTACPSPYLQQIKGQSGLCVLNCQYGSTIDKQLNICTCENRVNFIAPNYNCINSTAYYFGCYCQNNTFFDVNKYSCQTNCSNNMQPYLGICLTCQKGCARCSIATGLYYLNCTQCLTGFTLVNGICNSVTTCTPNCLECSNSLCITCQPFYVLQNGICKQICGKGQVSTNQNLTSTCTSQPISNICNPNCVKCFTDLTCVICQSGFSLLVTPISITCRKKNLFYTCKSKMYSSSFNSNVCYSNDSSSLSVLSKCIGSIPNCLVCHNKISTICLLCKSGYLLQQNQCVIRCSSTYSKINQGCIKKQPSCEISSFQKGFYSSLITIQNFKNAQYVKFINNGLQLTNQPYGFGLYFMNFFSFKTDVTQTNSHIQWIKAKCSQCQKGYGLASDKSTCVPCPQGCLLCLYANYCLATTNDQVSALTLSKSFSGCQSFISSQQTCILSCPSNTLPILNQTLQKMYCANSLQQSYPQGYVKVDGSTYLTSTNTYIHRFVFDSIISLKKLRLLQENNLTIDASGNSITFQNNQPTQILNLTGTLLNLVASNGQYPSNSVYGINQQTSFRNYITKWLAGIGYVLSIIILIIHCIYIANNILYKMDNIIIFIQTLYYFLFNKILISNPVAQYYYGFSWAHLNFFPNYFQPELNLSQPTIPPYALYNLDANIVRNAGSSLSLIFTFTLIWSVASFIIYLLDSKYGRKQIWYFMIFKNSIIALVQFASYNIFYWCIAFTNYDKNYVNSGTFIGLSVLLLTVLIIYIIGRMYFNLIAGIYMAKRLVYACVLASSYQHTGYVGIIIVMQLIFGMVRSVIEKPRQRWMLISLWVQEGFIIVFLIILYTTVNASVISILTTMFVYFWLLTFIADLSDLYFLSKNKYLQISCFKQLFQQDQHQIFRSTQSKQQTDRQISQNNKQHQK